MPMLNLRLARPDLLIDINPADQRLPAPDGNNLRLPALTRHRVLLEDNLVRRGCPLLAEAVRYVGNVRVRNRGTIGGSLAHADPTSEIGCCALASGAQVVVRGPAEDGQSDRTVPVLTALDLVRRTGRPSRDEIRYALVGNLCRCTGYTKILDAIEEYADQ